MKTLNEAITIIKSLFSAPLGSFPKGGVESALRVRLSSSPSSITLLSARGLSISLRVEEDKWEVEGHTYDHLEDAIYALIKPIILEEISARL